MAELSTYDIEKIEDITSNITKILSNLSDASFDDVDFERAEDSLKEYAKDGEKAKNYCVEVINDILKERAFLSRDGELNKFINENLNNLNKKLKDLNSDYTNKIQTILKDIIDVDNSLNEFNDEISFSYEENLDDEYDSLIEIENNDNEEIEFQENEEVEEPSLIEEKNSSLNSGLISNIDDILGHKKDESSITSSETKYTSNKKIVIRKNTPLDSDEIKELFIIRNSRYNLRLDELNAGIEFAGNNVDKSKILLGAMYKKYSNDLKNKDYFDLLRDIDLIIEFIQESDKVESLNLLFSKFYLLVSGFSMAHSCDQRREPFENVNVDPTLVTRKIIEINNSLNFDEVTLMDMFVKSKYAVELFNSLSNPFYDLVTSSKIMIVSCKNPNEILYCKDLNFKRLN